MRPFVVLAALLCLLTGSRAALAAAPAASGHRATKRVAEAAGKGARTAKPSKVPTRSDSVGRPNEGHLEGGVRLDTKLPYLRVVPGREPSDVRWGLPSLVHMLERAAKAVAKKFPGSALDVGDLSRKGGGDVLRHHSHESGRDADLGFYAVDAKGKQVHAPTFIKFENGFVSSNVPGAHFDLPRNWLLVQMLLTDPARTSHLFIAEPLRHALLAYAKKRGVSRALLDHAAVVMMQPTASLPHDDHMHVRVACPRGSHSACIELAKDAPLGRLAKRDAHAAARSHGAHHAPTLRAGTPQRQPSIGKHPTARVAPPPRVPAPPPSSKPAWAVALSGAALQAPDDEGAADAAEVKDLIDDVGLFKITE